MMAALAAGLLTFLLIGWTLGVVRAALSIPGVALALMLVLLVLIRCRHFL